jgi:hypothetical protein
MSELLNIKPELVVRLSGGLGNQLFKSLVGYQVAKANSMGLTLDTTWYSYPKTKFNLVANRDIEVNYFENLAPLCRDSVLPPRLHLMSGQILRRLPSMLRTRLGYLIDGDLCQTDEQFVRILDGSFEDYSLLPKDENLKRILKFPSEMSSWLIGMMQRSQQENPIAIHVRLGDYRSFPEIYGLLTKSYYRESLRLIEANSKSKIWLFSDEPARAIDWLGALPSPAQIIQVPGGVRAGEILRLMSSCPTIITAHSTFSWWAGRLGTIFGTSKNIVMPSRFFKHQKEEQFLLKVPGWHVISA